MLAESALIIIIFLPLLLHVFGHGQPDHDDPPAFA